MAHRGLKAGHGAAGIRRGWLRRFFLFMIFSGSVVLLLLSFSGSPLIVSAQQYVRDMVMPALRVVGMPVNWVEDSGDHARGLFEVYEQNKRLQEDNIALISWQERARKLEVENAQLRGLLGIKTHAAVGQVVAYVLTNNNGPYAATILIDAGKEQGVDVDQAVVASKGLIGRVIEAGERSSWVMLLSDINSRIPVVAEQSRERAILAGQGNGQLSLIYLATESEIKAGERIITASDGDMLPYGVPIGEVKKGSSSGFRVVPYAVPHRVDVVKVFAYHGVGLPDKAQGEYKE